MDPAFEKFYTSGASNDLAEALNTNTDETKEPSVIYLIEKAETNIIANLITFDPFGDEDPKNLLECSEELIKHKTNRSNDIPPLQDNLIKACFSPLLKRPDKLKKCLEDEIRKSKLIMPKEEEAIERSRRFFIDNFDEVMGIITRCKQKESTEILVNNIVADLLSS
jgi:hypothetical protein